MNGKHSDTRTCIDRQREEPKQERRLRIATDGGCETHVLSILSFSLEITRYPVEKEKKTWIRRDRMHRILTWSTSDNSSVNVSVAVTSDAPNTRLLAAICTIILPRDRRVHVACTSFIAAATRAPPPVRVRHARTSSTRRHSPRAQEPLPSASMRIAWQSGCRQSGADAWRNRFMHTCACLYIYVMLVILQHFPALSEDYVSITISFFYFIHLEIRSI